MCSSRDEVSNNRFQIEQGDPQLNTQSTNLNHLNFHQLQVVSRFRDLQLQVGENYSY